MLTPYMLDATGQFTITFLPKTAVILLKEVGPCSNQHVPLWQTLNVVTYCHQLPTDQVAAVIALSWWHCHWMAEDMRFIDALKNNNNNNNNNWFCSMIHLSSLCWSVLSVGNNMYFARMAEANEMLFGMLSGMVPRNHVLNGHSDLSMRIMGRILPIRSSSSCGLSTGYCRFHEWPCLSILCSMIGSCQTNVKWSEIRFNCTEPSLARSAWSAVLVHW